MRFRRHLRLFLPALALLLLVGVAAGCGRDDEGSAAGGGDTTSETTVERSMRADAAGMRRDPIRTCTPRQEMDSGTCPYLHSRSTGRHQGDVMLTCGQSSPDRRILYKM